MCVLKTLINKYDWWTHKDYKTAFKKVQKKSNIRPTVAIPLREIEKKKAGPILKCFLNILSHTYFGTGTWICFISNMKVLLHTFYIMDDLLYCHGFDSSSKKKDSSTLAILIVVTTYWYLVLVSHSS